MLAKNQKCLSRSRPALQSGLRMCVAADMDLDAQRTELNAAVHKALQALGSAPEDEKPLYTETWKKAEGRLSDFWRRLEPRPGGELGQGCFDRGAT